jgi:hypothetical protein
MASNGKLVIGAGMGAILGAAAIYVEGLVSGGDVHSEQKLIPPPEAFDMDTQAYTVFKKLEEFRDKKPDVLTKHYTNLLNALDCLFLHEKAMGEYGASIGDRSVGDGHHEKVERMHVSFLKHGSKGLDAMKEQVFTELLMTVLKLSEHHLSNIYGKTGNVR